jgi:hypothetical protein
MANERNAGRKRLYANESRNRTFYIPDDVYGFCKEAVREIIESRAERIYPIQKPDYIEPENKTVKRIKDLFEKAEFPCGCSIENNLLKRGKGKCKLTKEQHLKS